MVTSTASDSDTRRYGFRGWHYATADAKLLLDRPIHAICLDTGCTMSLVDWKFLAAHDPEATISKMASLVKVCGIGHDTHLADEYTKIAIFLPGKDRHIARIHQELHLVDNLGLNILLGINILAPEDVSMSPGSKMATIGSCDSIELDLTVQTCSSNMITCCVCMLMPMVIPAHTHMAIPIAD